MSASTTSRRAAPPARWSVGWSAERPGKVAIVAGSQGLRDHAERIFGFNQVMASEFPRLNVLPVLEGRDEDEPFGTAHGAAARQAS